MIQIPVRHPGGYTLALLSDDDTDLSQFNWSMAGGKGSEGKYAARHVTVEGKKRIVYMHRVVAYRIGLLESYLPTSTQGGWQLSIDHENGNKLDNQRHNLVLKNRSNQILNVNDELRVTNTSGFRGVNFVPGRRAIKKWRAYVTLNYKQKNLGWFATYEEAVEARIAWDEANK